jgi:hypothetical protein
MEETMSLKNLKKGDKVIMKSFTGMPLGVFTIAKATDKNITVQKSNGELRVFSRKTGQQLNIEEGKERFANSIIKDDGSYVNPLEKAKKAKKSKKAEEGKAAKKAKKAKKVEPVEELDELDDEDEFEDFDEE